MKTKLIIAVFLAVGVVFVWWRINYLTEQNAVLRAENKELKQSYEMEKKNVVEASNRIQELNKIIEKNPTSADYSSTLIDGALLKQLRKQYLSNKD